MKPCTEFDNQYMGLIENCLLQTFERSLRNNKKYQSIGPVNLILRGLPILTMFDINIKALINKAFLYISQSKNNVTSVMHALLCDSTSKNCVMNGERIKLEHITPYIVGSHFSIVGGYLNMSVLESSVDVFQTLPNTVFSSCILWHMLASRLAVRVGICSWNIGDTYIYKSQEKNIQQMLKEYSKRSGEVPNFNFNADIDDLGFAMQGKESLVHDIYHQLQPQYDRLKGPKL